MAINLLLVDDKAENLFVLEQLLAQADRELFRASSGNEALRLLLKHDFAAVLLDVEMPGMDGYETAELMRGTERTKHVPIIFVTAGDRSEQRTFRGYSVGAVDFLYKPINAQVLVAKVDVFVELYRKRAELAVVNAELAATAEKLRERVADLESVNRTLQHDLRAPLRTIRSFTSMIGERLAGTLDPEVDGHFGRVVRASDRMAQMLDDLYALLGVSSIDQLTGDVELDRVITDVIDNVRADLAQAGGTIEHDPLPVVRGNRALLLQILQNLTSNAIKFRGTAPLAIRVTATGADGEWQLGVHDNGIGVAAENRDYVFGLFSRMSTDAPGTGVGLALCKRAVEKHGGRIWMAGNATGGTTVYFTVPRAS